MGSPSPYRRGRRDPEARAKLAKRVLNRRLAGVSHEDLAREFRLRKLRIRELLDFARKLPGAPTSQPRPKKIQPRQSWRQPPVLTRKGSIGGDAMAIVQMRGNRTRDEPTHELQILLVGEWDAIDVGDLVACDARRLSDIERGKANADEIRVVERALL